MAITEEKPTQENPISIPSIPSISKPESGNSSMDWIRKHKGVVASIGGAAAGAAVTVALMSGEKGGNEPTPENNPIATTQPTPENSAQPTTQPAPEVSPTTIPGENVGSSSEVLVQTTPIEVMRTLPLEEFVKLSFADRYAYTALTLIELGYPEDQLFTEGDDPTVMYPEMLTESWNAVRELTLSAADPDVRAKLAAGMYYYTTSRETGGEISEAYAATARDMVALGGETSYPSTTFSLLEAGQLQEGTDRDGNPIEYRNITYEMGDISTGEATTPATTAQAIRVEVKTQDGRTFIAYPQGYTIEGRQSPVEGADY